MLHDTTARDWQTALWLGIGAAATNLAGQLTFGDGWPELGNLLVFLAAGALPAQGVLFAALIAVAPDLILSGHTLESLRLLALAVGGSVCSRLPLRPPLYVTTCLLWLIFVAGVWMLSIPSDWDLWSERQGYLSLLLLWDVLFSVLAGVLLLSPSVWGLLTGRPRHTEAPAVISHAIMLAATAPLTLLFLLNHSHAYSVPGFPTIGSFLLLLALCSQVAGRRVVSFLAGSSEQLLHTAMLGQPGRAVFSGMLKDFWRREKSAVDSSSYRSPQTPEEIARVPKNGADAEHYQGVCALARDGTILFMNHAFKILAGIQQNELVGRRIEALTLDPRVGAILLELIQLAWNGEKLSRELKVNDLPSSLRFLKLSAHQSVTESSEGEVECVFTSIEDITDRRTIEFSLIQDQRIGSLGTLVQGMSHAFNNVLTAIAGHASYARHLNDPQLIAKTLDRVVASCRDAGLLVRQLLQFVEVRPSTLRPERIQDLVTAQVDLLRRAIGEAYEIDLSGDAPDATVLCDEGLISQVLTSLILNARESYNQGTGKIWVSVETEAIDETVAKLHPGARPGLCARIRVRDGGRGMSSEALIRALDPSLVTKAQNGHAINLSLATVFAIVRAHDGFLSAESHPERGTTVSIYLPLHDSQRANVEIRTPEVAINNSAAPRPAADNVGKYILVVEDDDSIRDVIGSMISTLGYRVDLTRTADEALERCRNGHYDLVLADMVMPRMHGLELVEQLHGLNPGLRTLVMTGSSYSPPKALPHLRVLPKPFDLAALEEALRVSFEEPPLGEASAPHESSHSS